jgi:hypothetical protein
MKLRAAEIGGSDVRGPGEVLLPFADFVQYGCCEAIA